jgi:hypothetical protein
MDLFADASKRDRVSPFVQFLWEGGTTREKEVVGKIETRFLDLSVYAGAEKEYQTIEAMNRGEDLIYDFPPDSSPRRRTTRSARRAQLAEARACFTSTSRMRASTSVSCPQYCRSARFNPALSSAGVAGSPSRPHAIPA